MNTKYLVLVETDKDGKLLRVSFAGQEDLRASPYPKLCDLCGKNIESSADLDWHGYGNCVEITDEMWNQWEDQAEDLDPEVPQ